MQKQKQEYDKEFNLICDKRVQDFNTLLFSVRPLEVLAFRVSDYLVRAE